MAGNSQTATSHTPSSWLNFFGSKGGLSNNDQISGNFGLGDQFDAQEETPPNLSRRRATAPDIRFPESSAKDTNTYSTSMTIHEDKVLSSAATTSRRGSLMGAMEGFLGIRHPDRRATTGDISQDSDYAAFLARHQEGTTKDDMAANKTSILTAVQGEELRAQSKRSRDRKKLTYKDLNLFAPSSGF